MSDKVLAAAALVTLCLFVAVVPLFVPDPDLIILAIFTVGLAAFDFWRELFRRGGN